MPKYTCGMGDPLDMLAEECAEVIQAYMKHRRFVNTDAYRNPFTGETPLERMRQEVGDVLACIELLIDFGVFTRAELHIARRKKYERLEELFGYKGQRP